MEYFKKNKGLVMLIVGVLALIIFNWDTIFDDKSSELNEYSDILITSNIDEQNVGHYMIDIKGEVNIPGLYQVPSNLRVGDVIKVAGGITADADIETINLASKIQDEMIIIVPKIQEVFQDESVAELVKIIVEIRGEVTNPGVYELYLNSRVGDLINSAGGLTLQADIDTVSLVQILDDEMIITIPRKAETNNTDQRLIVEIKGEIDNPGIFYMEDGLRVYHLIARAGGVTDYANLETVDQARFLVDGETIIIPKYDSIVDESRYIYVELHGEVLHPGVYSIPETYTLYDLIFEAGGVTKDCDLTKINWDINLCLGAIIYIPSYDDEVIIDYENGLININNADIEILETLPGIGLIIGQRIIDYRAEYGDFLSIEDIMNVSGIKESIYEQVKEFITV
ncbi:MAG: SLBB domain-containing protein [Tenericutes bacterium]|nr:SLBB domain-containing protein [Mycoplasmatota bacterium]